MQFIQDGEWYKVVRVTGPAHNFLGLMFGGDLGASVVVQECAAKDGDVNRIDPGAVLENVLVAVSAVNRRLGTSYCVKMVQFCRGDTPPSEVYQELAKSIIESSKETVHLLGPSDMIG